jgi:ribosome-binding factor A
MRDKGRRARRVADLIKVELSGLIQFELRDPRIGFVTITRVEMTPDLRAAKVYFTVLGGDEELARSAEGLNQAIGFLRREIGHRLNLRYCPTLSFFQDTATIAGGDLQGSW